jgi:hypothetical protein
MKLFEKPETPRNETEQARVQRIRNEECKRLAARTAEALRERFGPPDDG